MPINSIRSGISHSSSHVMEEREERKDPTLLSEEHQSFSSNEHLSHFDCQETIPTNETTAKGSLPFIDGPTPNKPHKPEHSATHNIGNTPRVSNNNKPSAKAQALISKVISAVKNAFTTIKNIFTHIAAYVSKTFTAVFFKDGNKYPPAFKVPEQFRDFNIPYPGYKPIEFTAKAVLDNFNQVDGQKTVWAESPDFSLIKDKEFKSLEVEKVLRDPDNGRPLNPMGRTGRTGRGLLGKWGANQAGDPIVTTINAVTGNLELLVVQRKDTGAWAIPGGMMDPEENIRKTCQRELKEEAGATVEFDSEPVYKGIVDDPRNTDNAWMETVAIHAHISLRQPLEAGDDARAAKWEPITLNFVNSLYANHSEFVRRALERMSEDIINRCANKEHILTILGN